MIGAEFGSEKCYYQDEKTGRKVCQLTTTANNYHFYFLDNSFSQDDREIYFLSDRGAPQDGIFNVFKMDLKSGKIIQITDEKNGVNHRATKTPDSEFIVYTTGNKIKKVNTGNGQCETLYEEKGNFNMRAPFISPNKKYFGVVRNELRSEFERGPNYKGFKESMYAVKKAYVTVVYLDGSKVIDIYEDTHYLGHFQFAPDDSSLAMFCHEGPWNLVQQRIWLLDLISRSVKPCFRQKEDDCVGHEFWTRDGLIFFDNRRAGHDGTITSDKTQAVVEEVLEGESPYIGLADKNGELIRKINMPYYCNHYHANNDNTLLVGDTAEDVVLIDIGDSDQKPTIQTLCAHQTSWYTSTRHCHPTFSWNGDQILFESDRSGNQQLYLLDLS
jgi:oligogalacturonide lyase